MVGANALGQTREALELLAEERRVRLVGGREVGPETRRARARSSAATRSTSDRTDVGIALPEPPHARVVLDVEPGPDPELPSRARRPARRTPAARPPRPKSAPSATSSSASVSAPMVRMRASARWRRSSAASAAAATASQLAPPASAARAHSTRPVAVAVRLDHRAQLGRPRRARPPAARQLRSTAASSTTATARWRGTSLMPRAPPAARRSRPSRSPTRPSRAARPAIRPARWWA